jgi:hypothetical protein
MILRFRSSHYNAQKFHQVADATPLQAKTTFLITEEVSWIFIQKSDF